MRDGNQDGRVNEKQRREELQKRLGKEGMMGGEKRNRKGIVEKA